MRVQFSAVIAFNLAVKIYVFIILYYMCIYRARRGLVRVYDMPRLYATKRILYAQTRGRLHYTRVLCSHFDFAFYRPKSIKSLFLRTTGEEMSM